MDGSSPVRRIDHVVAEADDEQALFDFLTEKLRLPVAWPMAQWGAIHEAGVSLGNCNFGCNHPLDPNSDPRAEVRAIGFEPAVTIAAAAAELHRRGLSPTEPTASGPIDVPDEPRFAPWWRGWASVVVFGGPLQPLPFLCAYDHDVEARVDAERTRFDELSGGRLGITALRAVIIHTSDLDQEAASWETLLGPARSDRASVLTLDSGPELWIRTGADPPALLLSVRSTKAAIEALDELEIDHEDGTAEVHLDPSVAMGLDLRLMQGP